MSLIDTLRTLPGGQQPRKRKTLANPRFLDFLATHRLVTIVILVVTVAAIVLISFVGINSSTIPVFPNQIASVQITASVPFDYVSKQKEAWNRDQIRNRVPRVYKLDYEPLKKFEAAVGELLVNLETFEKKYPQIDLAKTSRASGSVAPATSATLATTTTLAASSNTLTTATAVTSDTPPALSAADAIAERNTAFGAILLSFNVRGPYHATADEVLALLNVGDAKVRRALTEAVLLNLREIYNDGVQDATLEMATPDGTATIFKVARPDGEVIERPVRTLEYARTELRVNLASEGVGRRTTHAIARLFDNGLSPNVQFDQAATERLENEAILKLPPAIVHVERGQTIIENNTRVTVDQHEMLEAYRAYLLEHNTDENAADMQLFRRILLVLAMVLACAIYIRIEDRETLMSNGRLALLALVVILNLALVRMTYWLSELPYFVHHSAAASTLPYLAPTALAPIIVAILIDAGSAIFMALLISLFTSVIYGNRLDVLVFTFFASMIATYHCQNVRRRGDIMRAALLSGVAVSAFALLFGIIDQQGFLGPDYTVPRQMIAGLANGLATGVIVVGLLPLIESLFKRTTGITLLELTDYNHPLLRRMQMEAPGTYHHSLVVAQLAENAANAIGANPLLARVCALFHDIGKTNKPEYFTENQRDRSNPHDENNPSLSALIIKSHVKDGVDLALKNKLPRAVIDVIQQHHGTTLIRYFYQRALGDRRHSRGGSNSPMPGHGQQQSSTGNVNAGHTRPGFDPSPVSETTYRYDGPRPQFKESAIIHLADGVEAASRSMRHVTPQHLGEVIDQIFQNRMEDGQLSESPLTFEDMSKIKSSFTLTLLNMLHSRVAYPPDEKKADEATSESKMPGASQA